MPRPIQGAHLKNEAWFIVQADPGSRLLKGLLTGVTRESFAKAIADGSVESSINSIAVEVAIVFICPAARFMPFGAGILAAEVQTPSDTTFRVFDFNRIDPSTGKLRTLHVKEAMKCIDFSAGAERVKPGPGTPPCIWRTRTTRCSDGAVARARSPSSSPATPAAASRTAEPPQWSRGL